MCLIAWGFLLIAGVAHGLTHVGALAANFAGAAQSARFVETVATVAVYLVSGPSEFVDVSYELAVGNVNIHVLTTLAVWGTVLLGCALEGALLLVLFSTAAFVEMRLTGHAKGDLKSLWATVPGEATVIDVDVIGAPVTGSEKLVPARDVTVGTHVFVKSGQQVPLDGIVVHGSAFVSFAHITGEALPVSKRVGDEIPAGAVNSDGALVVRALRSSEDSTPARIARLTEAAQNRRPSVSRLLDTFGDQYSKAILAITALTMILGPTLFGWPFLGRTGAMYRAFAFLSAAAPCALLMSPLVYIAAIGAAARRGVLVRGGLTLDALAEVGTVALDKTGTITTGTMVCVSVEKVLVGKTQQVLVGASVESIESMSALASTDGVSSTLDSTPRFSPNALAIAANLERASSHPIARAVLDAAASTGTADEKTQLKSRALPEITVTDFKVVHGSGVEGLIRTSSSFGAPRRARFGNPEWASEICGSLEQKRAILDVSAARSDKGNVTAALVVETCAGSGNAGGTAADAEWSSENLTRVFRFADAVHPKAAVAMRALREGAWRVDGRKMRVMMLTGDNERSAHAVADAVGLPRVDVKFGLTPGEKLAMVERARRDANSDSKTGKYTRVAMVGDGINDAPALAAADVGIAVASTPSEAAAAAADVLLLHADADGISQLPDLFRLAARTKTVLRQNITLAVVSILGSALPALVGAFPLWLAVLLHEGSTLLVALNSVRLLGTFGRQRMRRSTLFATVGVFAACCVGGAFSMPTVRAAALGGAGAFVSTPGFLLAATTLKSAWAGLLAGCLHTLTGPDHLAALAPLTVGPSRAQNAAMGALWGCGHNTGQILFGLVFVALKDKLPFNMEVIGQWGQGVVGATLVIIGAMGWWEARQLSLGKESHSHSHSHGLPFGLGKDMFDNGHAHHSHEHEHGSHDDDELDGDASANAARAEAARRKKDGSFLSWTYITGTIHGLQPDALLLLLPAFALPRLQAVAFLGTFFVGTVLAMGTYTACLGAGTTALQKKNPNAVFLVSKISSAVAVSIGVAFIASAVFGFEIF